MYKYILKSDICLPFHMSQGEMITSRTLRNSLCIWGRRGNKGRKKGLDYHKAVSLGPAEKATRICQKTVFLRD